MLRKMTRPPENQSFPPRSHPDKVSASASTRGPLSIGRIFRPLPTFWLIAALVLIKGILFIALLPPWQGPDEPVRFEAVHLTTLPAGFYPAWGEDATIQPRIIESMRFFRTWKFYDRQEPPATAVTFAAANLPAGSSILYEAPAAYSFYGLFLRAFPSGDLLTRLYTARAVSLFLHLLCFLSMAWMSASIFHIRWNAPLCLAVLLTYGLHPQLSFLASSVHADNLGFLFSLIVLGWILLAGQEAAILNRPWHFYRWFLPAGLLIVISAYAVRKTIVLLPFLGSVLPLLLWIRWKKSGPRKALLAIVFLFLALAAIGFFGVRLYPQILEGHHFPIPLLHEIGRLADVGWTGWIRYLLVLFTTFWMALGSLVYKLSMGWLLCLMFLTIACLYGWYLRLRERRKDGASLSPSFPPGVLAILCLFLFWIFVSVCITYGPHRTNAEGRYLLAATPALILLACTGFLGLGLFRKQWSASFLLPLWGSLALLLHTVVLLRHIIPIFYLP